MKLNKFRAWITARTVKFGDNIFEGRAADGLGDVVFDNNFLSGRLVGDKFFD